MPSEVSRHPSVSSYRGRSVRPPGNGARAAERLRSDRGQRRGGGECCHARNVMVAVDVASVEVGKTALGPLARPAVVAPFDTRARDRYARRRLGRERTGAVQFREGERCVGTMNTPPGRASGDGPRPCGLAPSPRASAASLQPLPRPRRLRSRRGQPAPRATSPATAARECLATSPRPAATFAASGHRLRTTLPASCSPPGADIGCARRARRSGCASSSRDAVTRCRRASRSCFPTACPVETPGRR
jgi:hypothetical protein